MTVAFRPESVTLLLLLAIMAIQGIGLALMKATKLRTEGTLTLALSTGVGLWAATFYLFIRIALYRLLGAPPINPIEVPLLAIFGWIFCCVHTVSTTGSLLPSQKLRLTVAPFYLTLLALLAYYAFPKAGLLAPPSSDPDIHAYMLKAAMASGTFELFYPNSDLPVHYPNGFVLLNMVFAYLTGLTAVQIVCLQPYIQGSIFAMLSTALFLRKPRTVWHGIFFLFAAFLLGAISLNPAFWPGREHLEGTARLAHSFLMMFPVFLAIGFRKQLVVFPSSVVLATCVAWLLVFALLINPVHVFPVGFLFIASLRKQDIRFFLLTGLVTICLGALLMTVDPYYMKLASGLTGGPQPAQVTSKVALAFNLQAVWARLPGIFELLIPLAKERNYYLIKSALALGVIFIVVRKRPLRLVSCGRALPLVLFKFLALSFALLVAIAAIIPGKTVEEGLILGYSNAAVVQVMRLFMVLGFSWLLFKISQGKLQRSAGKLALCMLGIIAFLGLAAKQHARDYPSLKYNACGPITTDDVHLATWASTNIPETERLLGPANALLFGIEKWVFPVAGYRAFGLYSDVPTAFFYGLDGKDFNFDELKKRLGKKPDIAWLKAKGIRWLYTNSEFPQPELAKYFEPRVESGRARLSRLIE